MAKREGDLQMKKGFVLGVLSVLVMLFMAGCDSIYNPLQSLSGGPMGIVQSVMVQLSLPYPNNVVYPGGGSAARAPAVAGQIYVESNLFAEGNEYPNAKKIVFNSIAEFNAARVRVVTGLSGQIKAGVVNGGALYDLWVNGTKLTNLDGDAAFLLMVDTDGKIIQLAGNSGPQNIRFVLKTNEDPGTTIYLSSDATGWLGVPMIYKGSQTWEATGSFPPNREFTFVAWSNKRAIYTFAITVNGIEAVYLIKIDPGTTQKYPTYHFKGEVDSKGKFINSGSDNRTAIIN